MLENPYRSPDELSSPPTVEGKSTTWHPLSWAVVGFAGGALLTAPFILCCDPTEALRGGAMFGGTLGALFGLGHGVERRRLERRSRGDWS
jgi:hypothetical protein